ncbi:MAG: hypothetical protein JWP32_2627 [Schumannella sp.]|nr:hypothetical protein [Schumannella sp.]
MRSHGDDISDEELAERVWFDSSRMHVALRSGRELEVPISYSSRLAAARADERDDWRLIAGGVGIHWPRIDEDLSVEGIIRTAQAPHPA